MKSTFLQCLFPNGLMVSEEIKRKQKNPFVIPLCLFLFVCEIPTDENTFLINVVLIAPCVFREEQSSMLTPLLLLFLFWYNKPPIHGIVTPYPWYFEHLPMVYHSTYPWYIEPSTHGILIPYPWYIEPSTNGRLIPLSMVFWHLLMVYRSPYQWYFDPPIYGILPVLSLIYWPPYQWYVGPLSIVFWPLPMEYRTR